VDLPLVGSEMSGLADECCGAIKIVSPIAVFTIPFGLNVFVDAIKCKFPNLEVNEMR